MKTRTLLMAGTCAAALMVMSCEAKKQKHIVQEPHVPAAAERSADFRFVARQRQSPRMISGGPSVSRLPQVIISDKLSAEAQATTLSGEAAAPEDRYRFTTAFDLNLHVQHEDAQRGDVKFLFTEWSDRIAPPESPSAADAPAVQFVSTAPPLQENEFLSPWQDPISTFSIDVDTASYSNLRRSIRNNQTPRFDQIRLEELINYFDYQYPQPVDDHPFAVSLEIADCPWELSHRLARVGIKARTVETETRPPCNLVFLVDVSGSMLDDLDLVKETLQILTDGLAERDRVAIVAYAGKEGLVLPSTPCADKAAIRKAIANLQSGGSTNGGAGITLAYNLARENFLSDGVNRVVLCTDGDFNVGVTSKADLVNMVEQRRGEGVFLTVLGFGVGNLNDAMLEEITGKGNGTYAYIDATSEARKVLDQELTATLVPVAKDVKLQVEFNPARVSSYRLIGYENRLMAARDFDDDQKDAGEIGAGHTVTALYEIIPATTAASEEKRLKYQQRGQLTLDSLTTSETMTLRIRYKDPEADWSKLLEFPVVDDGRELMQASDDFLFASSVAAWGLLLRNSRHKGMSSHEMVLEIAEAGMAHDPYGHRAEFVELVKRTGMRGAQ